MKDNSRVHRNESVTVNMTLQLYQWVKREAMKDHRSMSGYVENLLQKAAEPNDPPDH